MADFIALSYPSCGSKLQLPRQIERFSCASCGNEFIVNRSGGIVSLAPVVEGLKVVKVGVDKTASELAIKRLRQEISSLERDLSNAKESTWDDIKSGAEMGLFGIVLGILAIIGDYSAGFKLICGGIFIFGGLMGGSIGSGIKRSNKESA